MNLFQLLTLPLVAFLLVRSIYNLFKGGRSRKILFLSPLLWLSAGIAIFSPELTHRVAAVFGIGRGADLVLYLFVILYILSIFYIYNKFQKQDSSITEIVRQLAIQDALKRWPEKDTNIGIEETKIKKTFVPQNEKNHR
jgi:hypothetical protein